MRGLLIKWLVLTAAVAVSATITSQLGLGFRLLTSEPGGWVQLFFGSALLGLLNATLGKVIKLISTPLRCMTLGLFSLLINAFVLWLAGQQKFGFEVDGAGGAFVGSILISVCAGLLGTFAPDPKKKK